MSAAYSIDGVPVQIAVGTETVPSVSVRRSVVTVPGVHGTVPAGPMLLDERVVTVEAIHLDRASREALLARLAAPGDLLLTRTVDGRSDVAAARLVSVAPAIETPSGAGTLRIVLALPGVFFRDPSPVTSAAVPASGTSALTALAGGSAPITDAVVRVEGPVASVDVQDVLSGTGLSWSGTLSAGQYLFLHAGSLTARRSGSSSAWTSGGTTVSGGLDYPPPGPLQLWPDPSITVTAVGADESTAVVVRARRAYL